MSIGTVHGTQNFRYVLSITESLLVDKNTLMPDIRKGYLKISLSMQTLLNVTYLSLPFCRGLTML
jgi:hypothetical protein